MSAIFVLTADKMKNITQNFRLGFGSFVDKKTMPYVSTVPEKWVASLNVCQLSLASIHDY